MTKQHLFYEIFVTFFTFTHFSFEKHISFGMAFSGTATGNESHQRTECGRAGAAKFWGFEGDEGVPRPPYSMEYAPDSETFGAGIFRRLAEADAVNAQCAGRMAEMQEDLRNATNDINVLRQDNQDLRDEINEA